MTTNPNHITKKEAWLWVAEVFRYPHSFNAYDMPIHLKWLGINFNGMCAVIGKLAFLDKISFETRVSMLEDIYEKMPLERESDYLFHPKDRQSRVKYALERAAEC